MSSNPLNIPENASPLLIRYLSLPSFETLPIHFCCLFSKDDASYWLLTVLLLLLLVTNSPYFLVFGMQSVTLEPAQAHFPKLISHVSGSLILRVNKLSSFELHLLIYSVMVLLTLCVCGYASVAWDNDHCFFLRVILSKEEIWPHQFYL